MEAEFGTVAEWTAEVAADLGREYFVPAACRGSGSPTTLRWLIERLAISSRDRMLDCGAGVGGPAAFAAELTGVVPLLSDPEAGACRAARRLFGFPVVQAAVFIIATTFVLINLAVDLLYTWLDPRVRLG
jgi:protein-L-isoaspartate O-methyltransferase